MLRQRAGRDDDRFALERSAALQLHLDQVLARNQRLGALQVHDVDVVVAHMLFERMGELRSFGFLDRDEVLDAQRVEHLAAEALRCHAGADALARRIHGRRRAGQAAADDQHVERVLGGDLLRFALDTAGVDLREDLFQAHAALAELGAVQEHGGHGHHLAFLDLFLEGAALDHGGADARVLDGHQVQGLDHIGAVVAGERNVDLELEVTVERADLVEHRLLDLRGIAADLQQRKDQ